MKKYLIATLILGSLSLIFIIYIQISWLKLNINLQQNFLNQKIIKTLRDVGDKIGNKIINATVEKEKKSMDLSLASIFKNIDTKIDIKEIVNAKEINKYFKESLKKEGIESLDYYFGIMKDDVVIMTSEPNFFSFKNKLKDTISYKNFGYPINYKLQGKSLSNINQIEVLYFGFTNSNGYLVKKLSFTIALILIFTAIIIIAIYLSTSFILKQEQIEEMKTTFINNMTHEFKTPISTISIATTSMQTDEVFFNKEALFSYINIVKEENLRMLEMVELILQNALLSKGELRVDLLPISMHQLLYSLIEKHQLLLKNINGKVINELNATNFNVLADMQHLKIAISNIIENAIKYSKENLQLIIQTSNKNNQLIITITDNGIGIKPENLKHIFKKFYRINTKDKHNIKGFGLGLHYSQMIIQMHYGSISVKSKLNEGTSFIISLPLYFPNENTHV